MPQTGGMGESRPGRSRGRSQSGGRWRAGRSAVGRVALLAALVAAVALGTGGQAAGGVRLGDAVPGVIKKSDLARIKRRLDLEHFSVVAAVWLGASEGREAIIVEPLGEQDLAKVAESCKSGPFCPDRLGFVASRVRIVLLQNNDVQSIMVIDQEVRGARGRLLDLKQIHDRGAWVGWGGWAEAEAGHVALALMPMVESANGRLRGASDDPVRVQWNEKAGRFQYLRCAETEGEDAVCQFADELGS